MPSIYSKEASFVGVSEEERYWNVIDENDDTHAHNDVHDVDNKYVENEDKLDEDVENENLLDETEVSVDNGEEKLKSYLADPAKYDIVDKEELIQTAKDKSTTKTNMQNKTINQVNKATAAKDKSNIVELDPKILSQLGFDCLKRIIK